MRTCTRLLAEEVEPGTFLNYECGKPARFTDDLGVQHFCAEHYDDYRDQMKLQATRRGTRSADARPTGAGVLLSVGFGARLV